MFDPKAVKETCNGMLPVRTYERIYQRTLEAKDGIIVEVGTAHAAATVCMALALKDSGRAGRVYTFEKIFGGTREAFGGVTENERIIRGNLDAFGVGDYVELIIGDVRDEAHRVPTDEPISVLFLDADGRIDRDFNLFFDRVSLGGQIFIDDVRDEARVFMNGIGAATARLTLDQKHRISDLLLKIFLKHRLVGEGDYVGPDTWTGPKAADTLSSIDPEEIIEAYRTLVFADAELSLVPGRRMFKRMAKRLLPTSVVASIQERRDQRQRN